MAVLRKWVHGFTACLAYQWPGVKCYRLQTTQNNKNNHFASLSCDRFPCFYVIMWVTTHYPLFCLLYPSSYSCNSIMKSWYRSAFCITGLWWEEFFGALPSHSTCNVGFFVFCLKVTMKSCWTNSPVQKKHSYVLYHFIGECIDIYNAPKYEYIWAF